jgi:hypothetical protein
MSDPKVLVIDVESTCWEEPEKPGKDEISELTIEVLTMHATLHAFSCILWKSSASNQKGRMHDPWNIYEK